MLLVKFIEVFAVFAFNLVVKTPLRLLKICISFVILYVRHTFFGLLPFDFTKN